MLRNEGRFLGYLGNYWNPSSSKQVTVVITLITLSYSCGLKNKKENMFFYILNNVAIFVMKPDCTVGASLFFISARFANTLLKLKYLLL